MEDVTVTILVKNQKKVTCVGDFASYQHPGYKNPINKQL